MIMRPANLPAGIDLIHHATGLSDRALFDEAARLARLDLPSPPRLPAARLAARPQPRDRPHSRGLRAARRYARRNLSAVRGLEDPRSPDLLYNPDLTDFETARGWAGMVAIVRDGEG